MNLAQICLILNIVVGTARSKLKLGAIPVMIEDGDKNCNKKTTPEHHTAGPDDEKDCSKPDRTYYQLSGRVVPHKVDCNSENFANSFERNICLEKEESQRRAKENPKIPPTKENQVGKIKDKSALPEIHMRVPKFESHLEAVERVPVKSRSKHLSRRTGKPANRGIRKSEDKPRYFKSERRGNFKELEPKESHGYFNALRDKLEAKSNRKPVSKIKGNSKEFKLKKTYKFFDALKDSLEDAASKKGYEFEYEYARKKLKKRADSADYESDNVIDKPADENKQPGKAKQNYRTNQESDSSAMAFKDLESAEMRRTRLKYKDSESASTDTDNVRLKFKYKRQRHRDDSEDDYSSEYSNERRKRHRQYRHRRKPKHSHSRHSYRHSRHNRGRHQKRRHKHRFILPVDVSE